MTLCEIVLISLCSAQSSNMEFRLAGQNDQHFLEALRFSKTVKTPAWVLNGYTLVGSRLKTLGNWRGNRFGTFQNPYLSGSGKVSGRPLQASLCARLYMEILTYRSARPLFSRRSARLENRQNSRVGTKLTGERNGKKSAESSTEEGLQKFRGALFKGRA